MVNFFKESDFKRQGLKSKEKQLRLMNKDLYMQFSEKNIKK